MKSATLLTLTALLGGCANLSPDGGLSAVQSLVNTPPGMAQTTLAAQPDATNAAWMQAALAQPLTADVAVRMALLNNPGLHATLADLAANEATWAASSSLPNPHLAIGRFAQGSEIELERLLKWDILALITLPARQQSAQRQTALAQIEVAQTALKLAADTRKAWFRAVAASQSATLAEHAQQAAQASAELARRMVQAGSWSRLSQAREQVFLADATAQLARARQAALASREQLTRLLGLWGNDAAYTLPERLPDLPTQPRETPNPEATALRERLDVRSALAVQAHLAASAGLTQTTALLSGVDVSLAHSQTRDTSTGQTSSRRGHELELPLPLFDWGTTSNTRLAAQGRASEARLRAVAVLARSEAREAWLAYRTAWDLAHHHQQHLLPLRRLIQEETQLRYNGMLSSVFDLLAETRNHTAAINASLDALRDAWLADVDLHTALHVTSPGALAALSGSTAASGDGNGPKGH